MKRNEDQFELEKVSDYFGARPTVYLGCSLTSPDLTSLRSRLLQEAAEVFQDCGFDVYNPADHTPPGSPHLPREVYAVDHTNAMRCDLVFFIRLQPSLGMGMEAQIAADMLIPWGDVKIKDNSCRLTPLVSGLPNCGLGFQVHLEQADPDAFPGRLRQMLRERMVKTHAREARQARIAAGGIVRHMRLRSCLRRQRLLLNLTSEELANRTGVAAWWIECIERDEKLSDCVTLIQLERLMVEARLAFSKTSDGRLELVPIDHFDQSVIEAADEFVAYVHEMIASGLAAGITDEDWFHRWRDWLRARNLDGPVVAGSSNYNEVDELVSYLSMPVSNVDEETEWQLRQLTQKIDGAIKAAGLPVQIVLPKFQRTNREEHATTIYNQTVSSICSADFGIALLTPPATGVGVTAQLFANATLPCMLVAKQGAAISRMLLGAPFARIGEVVLYDSSETAADAIVDTLKVNFKSLKEAAGRRRRALTHPSNRSLVDALERFRVSHGLSHDDAVSELGKVPFLREEWFQAMTDSEGRTSQVTLLQLAHIVVSLGWHLDVGPGGGLAVLPPCKIHGTEGGDTPTNAEVRAAEESLTNLLEARNIANKKQLFPVEDSVVFEGWRKYCHELTMDAGRAEESRLVRTTNEWVTELLSDEIL